MFDGITVLMATTAAAVVVATVVAVVAVARGRGGELSIEHADYPPLPLPDRRPLTGTDAALLRLPLGLWGYHQQITDEALWRFARALTERDTRIAVLEQELAEARRRLSPDGPGPAIGAPDLPELPPVQPPADDRDFRPAATVEEDDRVFELKAVLDEDDRA